MTVQPTTTMPTDGTYGKVVGRFILAVADALDPDRLPDAVAAKGEITFTPAQPNLKLNMPGPTTVVRTQIKCSLDDDGNLIDQNGELGVWLMTGVYKVNYGLVGVTSLTGPTIEVLTGHTDDRPLDLTLITTSGGKTLKPSEYEELSAQIAAIPAGPRGLEGPEGPRGPKGESGASILYDTDGVPYLVDNPTTIAFDTDGVPYLV